MPSTFNGIGTNYHGSKNREKRTAACHSCGRIVTLESYDTRLWFVFIFIPIIPLGRKRIIDQCPVCKRHFAVDADQWETQKQLNVSGALDRYRADPTPESAMEAHQQLLNFHQSADAAELRREMAEKFRQNARVQVYLGLALSGIGLAGDATIYFQRAFELRPDLPEARSGLALDHIRAGRLAEARPLLDYLEKPGAAQLYSIEPLETLADAHLRANHHGEALDLYRVLLEALPQIGEFPAFRAKVKQCEKPIRSHTTILPKLKFSWKRFFGRGPGRQQAPRAPLLTWRGLKILATVLALFAGGMVARNEYVRRHRAIYVVNAFKQPATVEVRGVGTVRVGARPERLELTEGRYHASVSGPVREEFDFEVRTDYAERWSNDDAVWLLNVGGEALLLEAQVTYQASSPPPPKLVPHYARQIERVDRVTHPFVALPETVRMKSRETRVLTRLEFFAGAPAQLIGHLQFNGQPQEALKIAEWRLRGHPEDEDALATYAALADTKRAEDFLRAGLPRRPVQMSWHRTYQNLRRTAAWFSWLTVEYDEMLKADPQNSSLLYLRGRLASGPGESERWFARAREADPQNPYPHFALGFHCSSRADWEGARPLFARAAELQPAQADFGNALHGSRLALQEYVELEKELRAGLAQNPRELGAASRLVEVLAVQERYTEASGVVNAFARAVQGLDKETAGALLTLLRRHFLYVTGDFDSLAREVKDDRSPTGRNALFTALIEQGKVADAERIHPLDEPKVTDPFHFLTVGMAWALARDPKKADEWLRHGVQLLAVGSADDVTAAMLLAGKSEATPEQLNALGLPPKAKAIFLTALGMLRADRRAELYAAARRLNVDPSYPHQLVRRITESR